MANKRKARKRPRRQASQQDSRPPPPPPPPPSGPPRQWTEGAFPPRVGSRLAVHWARYDAYFYGVAQATSSQHMWTTIKYDDCEVTQHDLRPTSPHPEVWYTATTAALVAHKAAAPGRHGGQLGRGRQTRAEAHRAGECKRKSRPARLKDPDSHEADEYHAARVAEEEGGCDETSSEEEVDEEDTVTDVEPPADAGGGDADQRRRTNESSDSSPCESSHAHCAKLHGDSNGEQAAGTL
jgi:hypothetical protein